MNGGREGRRKGGKEGGKEGGREGGRGEEWMKCEEDEGWNGGIRKEGREGIENPSCIYTYIHVKPQDTLPPSSFFLLPLLPLLPPLLTTHHSRAPAEGQSVGGYPLGSYAPAGTRR